MTTKEQLCLNCGTKHFGVDRKFKCDNCKVEGEIVFNE